MEMKGEERMSSRKFCLALVFALALGSISRAQDSHVKTTYNEKDKRTVVATDPMYVENTLDQFMQVTFSFRYAGKQMLKSPEQVSVGLWSVTKVQRYRKDTSRKLHIVADGARVNSGEQGYVVLKGETFKGKDTFFSENRPALGLEISLPELALVKSGGVNGLFMEQVYMVFKPDAFKKIVSAKIIEVYLGEQRLNFSAGQINTLRDFARLLGS
jgi:hypothetical protein